MSSFFVLLFSIIQELNENNEMKKQEKRFIALNAHSISIHILWYLYSSSTFYKILF